MKKKNFESPSVEIVTFDKQILLNESNNPGGGWLPGDEF